MSFDQNDSKEIVINSTDKVLISGKSGSGKTTLMISLIKGLEPVHFKLTGKPYIKIDPLQQFGGEFIRYGDRISYDKVLSKMSETPPEFIVTDEADGFFPNRQTLSRIENDFIQIGRPCGLGGIFVTRRLARLHTELVANANKIFMFKLFSSADMQNLARANFGDFIPVVSRLARFEFLYIDTDNNDYRVFDPI